MIVSRVQYSDISFSSHMKKAILWFLAESASRCVFTAVAMGKSQNHFYQK